MKYLFSTFYNTIYVKSYISSLLKTNKEGSKPLSYTTADSAEAQKLSISSKPCIFWPPHLVFLTNTLGAACQYF